MARSSRTVCAKVRVMPVIIPSPWPSATSSEAKTADDFTISLWFNADATNFSRTARNQRYKLLRFTNSGVTTEEFYDLELDMLEASNILLRALTPLEQANLDSLRTRLSELSN